MSVNFADAAIRRRNSPFAFAGIVAIGRVGIMAGAVRAGRDAMLDAPMEKRKEGFLEAFAQVGEVAAKRW